MFSLAFQISRPGMLFICVRAIGLEDIRFQKCFFVLDSSSFSFCGCARALSGSFPIAYTGEIVKYSIYTAILCASTYDVPIRFREYSEGGWLALGKYSFFPDVFWIVVSHGKYVKILSTKISLSHMIIFLFNIVNFLIVQVSDCVRLNIDASFYNDASHVCRKLHINYGAGEIFSQTLCSPSMCLRSLAANHRKDAIFLSFVCQQTKPCRT